MTAQPDTTTISTGESALIPTADSLLDMPATTRKGYARPDTLHPGNCYIMPLPDDSTQTKVEIPTLQALQRQTYFSLHDSTIRTDLPYRAYGIAGDPVPYNVQSDNTVTALLLLCLVLFMVSLSRSRSFIVKQLKNFFRRPQEDNGGPETGGEQRLQLFLAALNVLVLSIGSYLLAADMVGDSLMHKADASLIAVFFAAYTVFFCTKWLIGSIVNLVFFGVKKNLQWFTLQLQVSALAGVLLFPMLALQIYFGFSPGNVAIYVGSVLILNKILTFFKSYLIFFQGNGLYLQTFLYFCALEIAPLLAFCGAGLAITDFVKINF